ncbi:MAG: hypothetical protein ACK559_30820, partial [bacterium]
MRGDDPLVLAVAVDVAHLDVAQAVELAAPRLLPQGGLRPLAVDLGPALQLGAHRADRDEAAVGLQQHLVEDVAVGVFEA